MKCQRLRFAMLLIITLFFSVGCASTLRNSQLEKVAKDWALVIRASQVIPVYPLTEDFQPGDVLLVSRPISDQAALYKEKGFLPLDEHLVRLYPKDYREFYDSRYGIDDQSIPPKKWQSASGDQSHNWQIAPMAAFPSYQFSVQTGSGLNLAIPIQGVPLALGLMNSGRASGTVTIADAHTYGLDQFHLDKMVRDWAAKNRSFLKSYSPRGNETHFLRVINRVYVTGRVNVSVKNDEAFSGDAAVGADKPVNLFGAQEGVSSENYAKVLTAVNAMAQNQAPGGRIKVATATSRTVSFSEEFKRPLVVGYIGFDIPIMVGGRLGLPVSTLSRLTEQPVLQAGEPEAAFSYRLAALAHMNNALSKLSGPTAERIRARLDSLDALLPKQYPFSLYESPSVGVVRKDQRIIMGAPVKERGFQGLLDYMGNADQTIETLEYYLKSHASEEYAKELNNARLTQAAISAGINREPVLMEAIDFVFLGD